MAPIPRLRTYRGPALLSYGFRPFFLFGSLYAGLAVLAWLPMFYGELALSTAFAPRDWHIHEMLYGYLSAVITGFLLTAVPNWTGRMPLQGRPLLVLVLVWAAGRIAVTLSAWIGWELAALIDNAFLLLVAAAVAREIMKGRNWRNLKVLIAVATLVAGNVVFHLEAHVLGAADYGVRIGIAAVLALIMLIGGRILPSFTRNWLARENPGRMPAPFGPFDVASLIAAGAALVAWIVVPSGVLTGAALMAAGLLQAVRLARWAGDRTWRDRLVLILHVAYAFVPLGFVLTGLAALRLLPSGAGIHAWTGGAMGVMTLAVMSRASLGHTGRALVASASTQVLYALAVAAALARVCAAVHPAWNDALLHVAGGAWAAAFVGFAIAYWAVFTRPRLSA
ncbi:NnrS family protein [Microvirga thermotolerans]|uniref:Short-chain dehydrogenase n=1 Tax=Microvirga thermotolerans TaxID=2651334 RepID=A0A5P9JRW2_9HYPH|nr:NnrS family protein [Microvirga thermotolerans]QFU14809.1 short-chain dehydrogenase [Microvirga thermotolerans]